MLLGAFLLVGCGVLGCSDAADEAPVAAIVDGMEMRDDDFLRSYLDYLITTGQNDTAALRRRHFDALIDAYLLGAEAERRGLAEDSALQAAARLARRRLIGARFYEQTVLDTLAAPSEADVRQAYRLGEEQRVVRHLFFRSPEAAAASYSRLEAGRPFLEEARSLYDTQDSLAGYLGAVRYWQLDDAFAEAAFSTPVGAYSPPVRSRMGYHIVYVEDRLHNPVLTEDAYARARKGIESRLRLRKRRLEGDAFVRRFMETRNVAVNRPALQALAKAIADLEGEAPADARQGTQQVFIASDEAHILGSFPPDTPLATFELNGHRQTFTLADYVFWLDVLPFAEARHRTGASLGRALRNEVLARAGEAAGIGDDPEVRHELERLHRLRLADALRVMLREKAPTEADTSRLTRIAEDLRLSPQRTVADFWTVSFPTRDAAERALPGLRDAPDRAASLPGYRQFVGEALRGVPALAAAVRAAPLGTPVLASAGEGQWAVVLVSGRRSEPGDAGGEVLAVFAAEADLIRRLRRERPVETYEHRLQQLTTPPAVPQRTR